MRPSAPSLPRSWPRGRRLVAYTAASTARRTDFTPARCASVADEIEEAVAACPAEGDRAHKARRRAPRGLPQRAEAHRAQGDRCAGRYRLAGAGPPSNRWGFTFRAARRAILLLRVMMNAVPARVAGVPRIVMVVPTPDNTLNPSCSPPPTSRGWTKSTGSAEPRRGGAGLRHADHRAGSEDRRPRQRLGSGGHKRRVFGRSAST